MTVTRQVYEWTLSGVEMGLGIAGVAHQRGGVARALEYLQNEAAANT